MQRMVRSIFDIARQRIEVTNKKARLNHSKDRTHLNVICEYLILSISMSCLSVIEQNTELTPQAVLSVSSDIKGLAASWVSCNFKHIMCTLLLN